MKPDSSHIKQIKVVSNTHWDREFRQSFERTRRRLLTMMDTTIDILINNPDFHSFTLDGHSIMIDDYLEMRPEKRKLVEKLMGNGRLVAGPYFTLPEEFSVSHEPLVRNLIWGRKTVEKYNGKTGTVAYTPASFGQTGQLPQLLADFGLNKVMFYRGVSHHECDAEYIWEAPDGTRALASRFALYARYNWYYQVFRKVLTGKTFAKDYNWENQNDVPFRLSDSYEGEGVSYDLKNPEINYDPAPLEKAVLDMVETEGPHFTTEVFLAMQGHDISVPHPFEPKIIADAAEKLKCKFSIEHTDLESYWSELLKYLDVDSLPILKGERRSFLKKGKWTYLLPATISARTYLKKMDFAATANLVYTAEPIAAMASSLGMTYPELYFERGWRFLLSNHTHDANGGCGPDAVCHDMEYRYNHVRDISHIILEDSMTHIAKNLSPENLPAGALQLIAFNTLPFSRDSIIPLDLELPLSINPNKLSLRAQDGTAVECQINSIEESSAFVDNIWDVPTILETNRLKGYANLKNLPANGYKVFQINENKNENGGDIVVNNSTLENQKIKAVINPNGSVDILNKSTGKLFRNLNYLTDQGETKNAWEHRAPEYDKILDTKNVNANINIVEQGPLSGKISAEYIFSVPEDYADGTKRSETLVDIPIHMEYQLEKNSSELKVKISLNNTAKDHWLRANFPTQIKTDKSWTDSHFDVLSHNIALPDSTGWVEEALGTFPMRTFADINDGTDGLALFTKGLFEYEVFDNCDRTMAITILRACRIKLAVSEEKQAELPDKGVQCPGEQDFEYSICLHNGNWNDAELISKAACYYTPVRAAATGRGKGDLPHEFSLFSLDNTRLHISCVKKAENDSDLIIRLFNPCETEEQINLSFGKKINSACLCGMDESKTISVKHNGQAISYLVPAKKIVTFKVELV